MRILPKRVVALGCVGLGTLTILLAPSLSGAGANSVEAPTPADLDRLTDSKPSSSGEEEAVSASDKPSSGSSLETLSDDERAGIQSIASDVVGVPEGSIVSSVDPSYNGDELIGGVAVLTFEQTSGSFTFFHNQVYIRSDGSEVVYVDHIRVEMMNLTSIFVAVNRSGVVTEFQPNLASADQIVSESAPMVLDSEGRTINVADEKLIRKEAEEQ